MAQITAFRALRYDPARVAVSDVATQPYDKITPAMQEGYYSASPFNLVRIILGKRNANDGPGDNPYSRAASSFRDWRAKGILLQDSAPSIYRYTQRFTAPGSKVEAERQGFIALGKLEDYSANVVHRHEQTLAKPKADRLDLLRATRAHFGQIFMLYSDPAAEIEGALISEEAPVVELRDEYGVLHQVWRVSEPGVLDFVRSKMQDKKLIIADGHHRYETALSYRNERRTAAAAAGADGAASQPISSGGHSAPAYEFAMMTFVNMDSPGLLILPTHRVVHGLESFSMETFRQAASAFFSVEEVDPAVDAARATAILKEAGHTGTALLAVGRDHIFLLSRPKAPESVFGGFSLRQQGLDVVQLHKCLIESVLGISEEAVRNQQNVTYIRDAGEAMNMVRTGKANVAFLMNPARMQQIRDIAFAGEVLPQKSTDFYPKLLSGLTVYALE
ncbi:MAG TPA: DUF1015 domain-containing protein [Terriglobales bacterium]|nr:DUF1015 domain-containing protein [Terriglobales bacterium]